MNEDCEGRCGVRQGGPMPEGDRPRPRDASFGSAYFRVLGVDAGNVLKPLLLSMAREASGSEWQRVRSGLASLDPWIVRIIDELALAAEVEASGRTPSARPENERSTHRNTSDHKPEK